MLQVDKEKFLIYKQFSLCFVNRYCSLFYVAFWLQDLAKLRVLLIVLLFASAVRVQAPQYQLSYLAECVCFLFQVVNNICEFVGPIVTSLSKRGLVCFLKLSINYFSQFVSDDLYTCRSS